MSKRLDAMRRNPRGDWTISDVEAICREFGITCAPSRSGSSHIRKLVEFIEAVRKP